jgi:hypothetical protein
LERSLEEVRRRTKVMGRFPGEKSCLSLCWAVLDLVISGSWPRPQRHRTPAAAPPPARQSCRTPAREPDRLKYVQLEDCPLTFTAAAGVRQDEASSIQRVKFPRRQGPASYRQASLAPWEVTSTVKRRQRDRQAATRVKPTSPVTCYGADADQVPTREGTSRRGIWRLRRRIRRGRRAWHAWKRRDGGTWEAHGGLSNE